MNVGPNLPNLASPAPAAMREGRFSRPVTLHVVHDWGGGIERWARDFAFADESGWNLMLKSRSTRNATGRRLELIDCAGADEPLLAWDLDPPIGYTSVANASYRSILDAVVAGFAVEAVIVSSLIGHSLEVFETGLPTVVVVHDFYPYCPALFAWFGEPCRTCESSSLRRCLASNPHNVFWHHEPSSDWEALREAYAAKLALPQVRVAAPSRGVIARYAMLSPALRHKPWRLIPHGLGTELPRLQPVDLADVARGERRLRVLVPGRLSLHKGLELLRAALPGLSEFAEILLLGSGEFGRAFDELEHVHVVPDYCQAELGETVAEFRPDCALLLSVLPETYSYTLSEMHALGVAPVATRLGAFAERIDDGATGFLVEPRAANVVARLRALAAEPADLARINERLRATPVRTATEMVAEYRALLRDAPSPRSSGSGVLARALSAALTVAREDARARNEALDGERARSELEAASRISALEADIAGLRGALAAERATAATAAARLAERLADVEAYRDALLGSTSWRLTRPLRAVREAISGTAAMAEPRTEVEADAPPLPAPDVPGVEPVRDEAAPTRVIEYRADDPLVHRRAVQLGERFGVPVVALGASATTASPLEAVVSLSSGRMNRSGEPGLVPTVFCVEDVPGPDHDIGLGWSKADALVVPTQAIAAGLIATFGDALPTLRVTSFPLLGQPLRDDQREAERARRREALGVPDKTRVVLGIGRADERSGLLQFARVASDFADRRNGYCFVWLGGCDPEWMRLHRDEIGLPIALRRLVLVDDEAFEPWLLAADAYLGCRSRGSYDAGAVEALAAGLPAALLAAGSLPDALLAPEFGGVFDLAVGDEALVRLAAWVRAPLVPRLAAARLVRERFGSAGAAAAFDAAFEHRVAV